MYWRASCSLGRNANVIPSQNVSGCRKNQEMVTSKMKFGLGGIWARLKIRIAESKQIGLVLVLAVSLGFAASAQAAEAEADGTGRADSTGYANFQSAVRDQMHASAELPQEAQVAPTTNNWNNLVISVEMAICIVLSSRLFAPRICTLLDRHLNPVSAPASEPTTPLLKKKGQTTLPVN